MRYTDYLVWELANGGPEAPEPMYESIRFFSSLFLQSYDLEKFARDALGNFFRFLEDSLCSFFR